MLNFFIYKKKDEKDRIVITFKCIFLLKTETRHYYVISHFLASNGSTVLNVVYLKSLDLIKKVPLGKSA